MVNLEGIHREEYQAHIWGHEYGTKGTEHTEGPPLCGKQYGKHGGFTSTYGRVQYNQRVHKYNQKSTEHTEGSLVQL